jgi:hypothetical protein
MKQKTYLNLLFLLAFAAFVLWIIDKAVASAVFFNIYTVSSLFLMIEFTHAVRRKYVRGRWFFNPFNLNDFIIDHKARFGKDI